MKTSLKKLLAALAPSAAQVPAFVFAHGVGWRAARPLASGRGDVLWYSVVIFAVYVFALLSVAATVATQFVFDGRGFSVQLVAFLTFAAFFANNVGRAPYRVLLLLEFSGLVGFMLPLVLLRGRFRPRA